MMREYESPRVVVVEDEARLRDVLVRMLHELEHEATAYASGEAAWRDLAEGDDPVVLLTDLMLPGMSGLDLAEKVQAARPGVAVIVLTAFGSVESAQRAIRLDAADFLTKPCSMGELDAAVSRAAAKLREPVTVPRAIMADDKPGEVQTIAQMEHEQIEAALARHEGNRRAAADELGISLRTLYYRLKQYRGES